MKENEHLQCSKLVGSPFLCNTGFSHEGIGPVKIPTDGGGGSLRTGTCEFPPIGSIGPSGIGGGNLLFEGGNFSGNSDGGILVGPNGCSGYRSGVNGGGDRSGNCGRLG